MKSRIISGAVMAVVLAAVVALGLKFPAVFVVAASIIAAVAYKEFIDVKKGLEVPTVMKIVGLISMIVIACSGAASRSFIIGINSQSLSAIFLAILGPCVILRKHNYKVDAAFYLAGITVFLGLIFNLIITLFLQNILLLLYVIIIACCTDIFALVGGKLIGKHKFTKISPNKTLEGCFTGSLISVIISTTYYMTFIGNKNIFIVILLTLLLSVIGQIGDLFFSLIKRENDVKDFSNLIPGHGGILDRLDSIIFILITYVFVMQFI